MKKTVASLTMSLAFIAGCTTANIADVNKTQQNDSMSQTKVKVPEVTKTQTISSYFITNYFKIAVPSSWTVVSYDGPEMPTHVSLKANDSSALITIRIAQSKKDIDSLCQEAAKRFVADSKDIVLGPEINYGTCSISADAESNNATLWQRKYDDNSVYSIYFEGDIDKVNEVLQTLEGNEKMMNLLVMPLKLD